MLYNIINGEATPTNTIRESYCNIWLSSLYTKAEDVLFTTLESLKEYVSFARFQGSFTSNYIKLNIEVLDHISRPPSRFLENPNED